MLQAVDIYKKKEIHIESLFFAPSPGLEPGTL